MRLSKNNTIALAVDFQSKLMPAIFENQQVLKNSSILIKGLKVLGVPIIVTEQYPKGLGETVDEIKTITSDCKYMDKITFSCYLDEKIKSEIDGYNAKNIVLFGTETHICVIQTAIDLLAAGYNVFFVGDCVSSRKIKDHEFGLKRAEQEGAFITSYEAILFELTEIAGTDSFKEISKLIK